MNANLKKTIAAVIVLGTLTSANVQARGFLAGILEDVGVINEDQRTVLDDMHAAMGNPLDHAFSTTVNTYVPGAGDVMEANWEYRRQRAQQQARYEQQRAQQEYYQRQRAQQQAYYQQQQRAQQMYYICRQNGYFGYNPTNNTCY